MFWFCQLYVASYGLVDPWPWIFFNGLVMDSKELTEKLFAEARDLYKICLLIASIGWKFETNEGELLLRYCRLHRNTSLEYLYALLSPQGSPANHPTNPTIRGSSAKVRATVLLRQQPLRTRSTTVHPRVNRVLNEYLNSFFIYYLVKVPIYYVSAILLFIEWCYKVIH